jgi:GTPase SAR1 family protein
MGISGVGRTALLNAFEGKPDEEDYDPSPFDGLTVCRPYAGKQYKLHLQDAWGDIPSEGPVIPKTPCFSILPGFDWAHCILLCFALDNPYSLKRLTDCSAAVKRYDYKALFVLVGTKSDLWNPGAPGAISQADIDAAAGVGKAHKVVYCSARTNEGIEAVFDFPVGAIRERFPMGQRPTLFAPDTAK